MASQKSFNSGEKACSQRLRGVPLPFDILILGMGSDGHTASLFPGAKQFSAAVDVNSGRIWMGCPKIADHDIVTVDLQVYLRF